MAEENKEKDVVVETTPKTEDTKAKKVEETKVEVTPKVEEKPTATKTVTATTNSKPSTNGARPANNNNNNNRNGQRRNGKFNNRRQTEFEERVVNIARVTTVVKGGRRFSFSALVVVGNKKGKVG